MPTKNKNSQNRRGKRKFKGKIEKQTPSPQSNMKPTTPSKTSPVKPSPTISNQPINASPDPPAFLSSQITSDDVPD